MTEKLRILLVEDKTDDVALIQSALQNSELNVELHEIDSLDTLASRLRDKTWDLVLSGFMLDEFDVLEVLDTCQKIAPNVPLIIVSDAVGEEATALAMRRGAGDFVRKDNLEHLEQAIRRVLRHAAERHEHRAQEHNSSKFQQIFDNSTEGIYIHDLDGRILEVNQEACRLLGYEVEELVGQHVQQLVESSDQEAFKARLSEIRTLPFITYESELLAKNGRSIPVEVNSRIIDFQGHSAVLSSLRDTTRRHHAEKALFTSHAFLLLTNQNHDLDTLLNVFLEKVYKNIPAEMCGIHLTGLKGQAPLIRYHGDGQPSCPHLLDTTAETEHCLCRRVLEGQTDGHPSMFTLFGSAYIRRHSQHTAAVTPDEQASLDAMDKTCRFESMVAVPLRSGEQVVGLLHVLDSRPDRISPQDVEFLERISIQLANAILRAWAEDRLRYRVQSEELLNRIATRLIAASQYNLEELLDQVLPDVIEHTGADRMIVRYFQSESEPTLHKNVWYTQDNVQQIPLPKVVDPDTFPWSVQRLREDLFLHIPTPEALPPEATSELTWMRQVGAHSLIAAPFFNQDQLVGYVALQFNRPQTAWSNEERIFLQTLAGLLNQSLDYLWAEQRRTELEQQLRQQQKLEAIGTLAGGVAHEINNPLNGIMNYAELIVDRAGDDERLKNYGRRIMEEGKRVNNIVRNLLAFAREDKEAFERASLPEIVDASLSILGAVLRKDQIKVELEIEQNLPQVICRPQKIQQVIMNFLTNARDALNERYSDFDDNKIMRVKVGLVDTERGSMLRISVTDHGSGIAPDICERIFDPFFTTKSRQHGTGLGLAVSHGIVQEHHGNIEVESREGEYTVFHMDLQTDDAWAREELARQPIVL